MGNLLHLFKSLDGSRDCRFPIYTFLTLQRLVKSGIVCEMHRASKHQVPANIMPHPPLKDPGLLDCYTLSEVLSF